MTLLVRLLKQTKTRFALSAVVLCLFLSTGASAQQNTAQNDIGPYTEEEPTWGIGVVGISNQQGIQDIDRDTRFIPIVTYENQYIRWFGPFIDFKLPSLTLGKDQNIEFNLAGGFDFGGYDDEEANDTPILQGMDEREGAFAVGPKVKWNNPWVNIEATWMTDVSGDREGSSASLTFEKNWMFFHKVMLSPYMGINWLDDNFVDFHYGVRTHEVTSNRAAYIGESTINLEYGIRAAYIFNKKSSVIADIKMTSLGNEIKDSPLVDSSTENNILLIYMYKF